MCNDNKANANTRPAAFLMTGGSGLEKLLYGYKSKKTANILYLTV
jgi:hypothetical protein